MARAARIAAVTLGLAALGAVTGGVASYVGHVFTFLSMVGLSRPWSMVSGILLDPRITLLTLAQGARVGVLLGPVVGWLLLRRVPLGWAGVGLTAGAFVGGVAGSRLVFWLYYGVNTAGWFPHLWGAGVGVLLAAVVLRVMFRPRHGAHGAHGADAGIASMPTGPGAERLAGAMDPSLGRLAAARRAVSHDRGPR